MHEYAMREALKEAALAALAGDVPVGAVVVHDGSIIVRAHNEREVSLDPTAHAEVLAIRRAAEVLGRRRLNGCTLYVTLEPCPMCAGTIAMSGVERVYYGAYDPRMGCTGSVYDLPEDPVLGTHTICMGGLLEDECSDLIAKFFADKR